jgi:hypothetical protein
MSNTNQTDNEPIQVKIEKWMWFCQYPATTVTPLFRWDLGERELSRSRLIGMTFTILFMGSTGQDPRLRSQDLYVFAIIFLASAAYQRWKRRRERARGMASHTRYIGTSILRGLPWPYYFFQERRIERFIDPIACFVAGRIVSLFSPSVGAWLSLSAIALRTFEYVVHKDWLKKRLDISDALMEAGFQSGTVEFLEDFPAKKGGGKKAGLATGLGDDLKQHKNN